MTTADFRPPEYNIHEVAGADLSLVITCYETDGTTPVDVSGYTFAADVLRAGAVVDSFAAVVSGVNDNIVTLTLTDAETAAIGTGRGLEWALKVTVGSVTDWWYAGDFRLYNAGTPRDRSGSSELTAVVGGAITALLTVGVPGAGSAANVSIVDAGTYFTGTDVEAALQEVGAELADLPAQYAPSVLDEDDFATNSATRPPSQQSVAEYAAATFALLNTFPKPIVGLGYPVQPSSYEATGSATLDRMVAFAVQVPHPVTIDQLGIYIVTGEATSTCRLALYSPAANGTPGALLGEVASAIDCSTLGAKTAALSSAVDVTTGLVYFAYVFNTASSTVRFRRYPWPGGGYGPVGLPGSAANVLQGDNRAYIQNSVSGALPDPMVAVGGGGQGQAIPLHFLRVSAIL